MITKRVNQPKSGYSMQPIRKTVTKKIKIDKVIKLKHPIHNPPIFLLKFPLPYHQ